jgi:hypothetical protein
MKCFQTTDWNENPVACMWRNGLKYQALISVFVKKLNASISKCIQSFIICPLRWNWSLFSSPELKAQVSYSDHLLSVVRLSVRLSVNFYIFDFFSRTNGPVLTKLGTNHPWGEGILNCSNEGDCPCPRGDNYKRVKMGWVHLKIFFSRTTEPE